MELHIPLIIRQHHHVLPPVPVPRGQERSEVLDVVDAAAQLAILAEVVYPDEEGLAPARAGGVLEGVVVGGAVAEVLEAGRGWGGGAGGGAGAIRVWGC